MWRSLLLKGTTCLVQVAAPEFIPQRHFTSPMLRLVTQRLLYRPAEAPCGLGFLGAGYILVRSGARAYKRDEKSTVEFPRSPITVTEIKQYLRSKKISFHDGYSCLHTQSIFLKVTSKKDRFSLFIDKTTGQFLCKDTMVEGSWEDLQDCLEVKQKEGQDFLSPHVLPGYPERMEEQEEMERELREVQRIWSSSVSLADVPEHEAQLIKTMFQVLVENCCCI